MKKSERNGKAVVQNPAYEDSGVAISGEPSFFGECDGIVSPQAPKGIEEDVNPDLRFDIQTVATGIIFLRQNKLNKTYREFN